MSGNDSKREDQPQGQNERKISQPWYRADPTTHRRFLAATSQYQLQLPPKHTLEDDDPLMTQQSKKKQRVDDESLPTDSGTKPIQLQRRRVWRACESCRRKKIKCDGCEPTCSQCQSSGSQCTWLQTKDRAALSRHYVQELEARLLHMESIFTQITPVLDQLGPSLNLPGVSGASSNPGSSSEGKLAPASAVLQALSSKVASEIQMSEQSSPESSIVKMEDEVSESLGQLALDEHGHMRWIGGSSTMSLIQSFRSMTTPPLHRISPLDDDPLAPGPSANKLYFPASVFFGKVHALPGPEEVEYPDEDLAEKLVDAYFSRFHFLFPVLDKPLFMQKYRSLMNNRGKGNVNYVQAEAPFTSVVFAVFACAARFVEDPRLQGETSDDGGMGMIYYERALILHYISHASIQLYHVQSLALMSSFLCSVNCLPQAWLLVGQAVRSAQDLGLHRSSRRLNAPAIEKETRKKVWWSVYALDRMLALALGRPLGVEDSDCDAEFPVDVDDEALPEYFNGNPVNPKQPSLMSGALFLIRLYQICGRVLRQVYAIDNYKDVLELEKRVELQRRVDVLDAELAQWFEELPPAFKTEPVTEQQYSMAALLCSHYYSVHTALHRNFLPVKRNELASPTSTAKAVNSARACIRLSVTVNQVVPPSHHLSFFIQHLFSSAVIILLYAMHGDPKAAPAAMDEVRNCLRSLEAWEGHWPGARKCKELLSELIATADDAVKKQTMPPPVAPALLERRHSVSTSAQNPQFASPNRPMKSKPRRISRSRDPSTTRRAPVSTPYRVDSQRNRSTSRKRGHDESEGLPSPHPSIHSVLSSPTVAGGKPSPHGSPASGNLPSPSMSNVEGPHNLDDSPQMPHASPYSYGGTSLSPLHVPSPRFEYDYGMHQSPLAASSSSSWDVSGSEHQMFSPSSPTNPVFSTGFETHPTTMDAWYNGSSDIQYSLSTTPPGASFATPGLPFHGLDYIRNFNPNGYPVHDQDSLWQQGLENVNFGFDPELPFNFGDAHPESHDNVQHPSSSHQPQQ